MIDKRRYLELINPPANLDITTLGYSGCETVVLASIPGCERCDDIWASLRIRVLRSSTLAAVKVVREAWTVDDSPVAELAVRDHLEVIDGNFRFPVAVVLNRKKVVVQSLAFNEIDAALDALERGEPATGELTRGNGATPPVGETAVDPPAHAEREPRVPNNGSLTTAASIALGVAVTGGVATIVLGVVALDAKADYKGNPDPLIFDRNERSALLSDVFLAVAIGAGVTSGILFGLQRSERPPATDGLPRGALVSPYFGPDGGGCAARLRF